MPFLYVFRSGRRYRHYCAELPGATRNNDDRAFLYDLRPDGRVIESTDEDFTSAWRIGKRHEKKSPNAWGF